MSPLAKRIVIQGALAAGLLALVGLALAELASMFVTGNAGRPNSADLNPAPDALRYRVPLTLAAAGFVFVAVGEWIAARLRARKAAATPAPPQPDDAEKLLNELLTQSEAKTANEAEKTEGIDRTTNTEETHDTDKKQSS